MPHSCLFYPRASETCFIREKLTLPPETPSVRIMEFLPAQKCYDSMRPGIDQWVERQSRSRNSLRVL